jgi:hypothetical protein
MALTSLGDSSSVFHPTSIAIIFDASLPASWLEKLVHTRFANRSPANSEEAPDQGGSEGISSGADLPAGFVAVGVSGYLQMCE